MLSSASAARAGGQMGKEAALNVGEWIREADYASEVISEKRERKKRRSKQECVCLNVSMHAFHGGLCVSCG